MIRDTMIVSRSWCLADPKSPQARSRKNPDGCIYLHHTVERLNRILALPLLPLAPAHHLGARLAPVECMP